MDFDDDLDALMQLEEQVHEEQYEPDDWQEEEPPEEDSLGNHGKGTKEQPTAMAVLNGAPKSSTIHNSSNNRPLPPLAKKIQTKLTAHELALELQAMRKELGQNKDVGAQSFIQLSAAFVSMEPLFRKVNDGCKARCLLTRPEMNRPHVTCVLNNGSRVFLSRRPPRVHKENHAHRVPLGTNLLSKPMTELLHEAQAMEVQVWAPSLVQPHSMTPFS